MSDSRRKVGSLGNDDTGIDDAQAWMFWLQSVFLWREDHLLVQGQVRGMRMWVLRRLWRRVRGLRPSPSPPRPAGFGALPAGSETLPAGCKALPAGSEALPASSEALLACLEALPTGFKALPAGSQALPTGSEVEQKQEKRRKSPYVVMP